MSSNVKLEALHEILPIYVPEKAVTEYFISRSNDKLTKKRPEWDVARLTPVLNSVEARREFTVFHHKLKHSTEVHQYNQQQLCEKWASLRSKSLQLKQSLIHFDTFIQENEEKRLRSEKGIIHEDTNIVNYVRDINIFTEKINHLENIAIMLEACVDKCKIYEEYLRDVVKFSKFITINDVIKRYDALIVAKLDLAYKQKNDIEALQIERDIMIQLTEEKDHAIMGLNNELANLQHKCHQAKLKAFHWENIVSRIENNATLSMVELGQVIKACWNMHQLICKRKGIKTTCKKSDVEGHLIDLKTTINCLHKIVHLAHLATFCEGNTLNATAHELTCEKNKNKLQIVKGQRKK